MALKQTKTWDFPPGSVCQASIWTGSASPLPPRPRRSRSAGGSGLRCPGRGRHPSTWSPPSRERSRPPLMTQFDHILSYFIQHLGEILRASSKTFRVQPPYLRKFCRPKFAAWILRRINWPLLRPNIINKFSSKSSAASSPPKKIRSSSPASPHLILIHLSFVWRLISWSHLMLFHFIWFHFIPSSHLSSSHVPDACSVVFANILQLWQEWVLTDHNSEVDGALEDVLLFWQASNDKFWQASNFIINGYKWYCSSSSLIYLFFAEWGPLYQLPKFNQSRNSSASAAVAVPAACQAACWAAWPSKGPSGERLQKHGRNLSFKIQKFKTWGKSVNLMPFFSDWFIQKFGWQIFFQLKGPARHRILKVQPAEDLLQTCALPAPRLAASVETWWHCRSTGINDTFSVDWS